MNPLSPLHPNFGPCARALGLLSLVLFVRPAGAAAAAPDRTRFGFTGAIGYGRATGTAGDFLDDTWSADFNVFLEKGRFRGGIGAEFHRFTTVAPVAFPEVSAVPFYLYGTFPRGPRRGYGPTCRADSG